ncbi:hypothetical protein CEXT_547211 [Caerostris extrusa]|uniref:Uncharacterized protein n=1 Tax=Caerostris extrusa TaxID=172846 RepID=A0AAV4VHM1_CAEEX|nr:hypothetical protein CEXT_547211 [Caerostris extrusa]
MCMGRKREKFLYADELENGIKHSRNWKVGTTDFFPSSLLILFSKSCFNKGGGLDACSIYRYSSRNGSIQQLVLCMLVENMRESSLSSLRNAVFGVCNQAL